MWRIKFAELHRSLLKFDEKKWQSAIFADCRRSEPKKVSNVFKVPNIENANISKDFLLLKGDYVFVIYGNQICIRRVIAIYFEAYSNHCNTDKAITDLHQEIFLGVNFRKITNPP